MRAALFMVLPLMLTGAHATPPPEKPPAPPIDLGDWDKPSKPIWMETELQEQARKVQPLNREECLKPLIAAAITKCPVTVVVMFDVTPGGQTTNIRLLETEPPFVLDKAAQEVAQCLRFAPASDTEAPDARKDVILRHTCAKQ